MFCFACTGDLHRMTRVRYAFLDRLGVILRLMQVAVLGS